MPLELSIFFMEMEMKVRLSGLAFALAMIGSPAANAGVVTVWGEALSGFSLSTINDIER